MKVDRIRRDALVQAINRYLDGETTAFQFDDEIFGIKSDDFTVNRVVSELWYFYDDCKDHKVNLSKEEWDSLQRLILVLKSDGHIIIHSRRTWHASQLIAAACLLIFCRYAAWMGFGIQLIALSLPFGIVSILLSYWNRRSEIFSQKNISLLPFSTFSEVLTVHRTVPIFQKRKSPTGMTPFRIRSPLEMTAINLKIYAFWLMFSPVILLFQILPKKEITSRVEMPSLQEICETPA